MSENWRPVVGYEGLYEVSDLGRVRSIRRALILKAQRKHGYLVVQLNRGSQPWQPSVHSLVMLAFVGPRPFDGAVIRHLDGVKANARLTNLCYGTRSENERDKRRLGELPPLVTHCRRGHEFNAANTYSRPDEKRCCRTCHRAAQARYLARRAAVTS